MDQQLDGQFWLGLIIVVVVLGVWAWQMYAYHRDPDAYDRALDRCVDGLVARVKRLLGR